MKGTKVANRYAKALLDLAVGQKSEDKILNDVKMIRKLAGDSKDFEILLKNPIVNTEKKSSIMDMIFKGKIDKTTSDFLHLVVNKGREKYLVEMLDSFEVQYKEHKGIIDVEIISAIKVDKRTLDAVMVKVKAKYSGTFNIQETISKEVIGGFILKVGHEQIDMSIARKLSDYKQLLLQ